MLKPESGWYNYLNDTGLKVLQNIKDNKTTGDATTDKEYWQGIRAVPHVFLSYNEEKEELNKELKKYTDALGTKTPAEIKAEIDQLKIDLAARDATILELNNVIKEKQKTIDDMKGLPEKVKELNEQLTDKNNEVKKLTDEKSDWEKIVIERNKTIAALNADNRIKDLEKTVETKNKTISERDNTIEDLRKRIKEFNKLQASQVVPGK